MENTALPKKQTASYLSDIILKNTFSFEAASEENFRYV